MNKVNLLLTLATCINMTIFCSQPPASGLGKHPRSLSQAIEVAAVSAPGNQSEASPAASALDLALEKAIRESRKRKKAAGEEKKPIACVVMNNQFNPDIPDTTYIRVFDYSDRTVEKGEEWTHNCNKINTEYTKWVPRYKGIGHTEFRGEVIQDPEKTIPADRLSLFTAAISAAWDCAANRKYEHSLTCWNYFADGTCTLKSHEKRFIDDEPKKSRVKVVRRSFDPSFSQPPIPAPSNTDPDDNKPLSQRLTEEQDQD